MKKIGYGMFTVLLMTLFLLTPILAQEAEGAPEPVKESALAGYTAGLNVGYPVVTGEYYKGRSGPIVGLAIGSPYGFALGPFNIGIGGGVELALMEETEIGFFGTLNSTVFVTPRGPISLYGGVGLYGGAGIIGGAYFDFMVPNMPLVLKPYVRAVVMSSATDPDLTGGEAKPSGWINVGIMALYDISTLF